MSAPALTGVHGTVNIALITATVILVAWAANRTRKRNRAPLSAPLPPLPTRTSKRPGLRPEVFPGQPVDGEPLSGEERYRLSEIGMDSFIDVPEPTYQSTGEA